MMKEIGSYKKEIGLLICILGTQFSRILIELFQINFDLTNVLYLIGLLLLPDYALLSQFKIRKLSRNMILILVYQLIVLVEAFASGQMSSNDTLFTLFVAAMIILLSTNAEEINSDFFVEAGWLLTGIGSAILCYFVTNGFTNFTNIEITRLPMGSDRLTLSAIAFAYLIFMLAYQARNMLFLVLKFVFAFVAIIDVMACSRRGLMLSYLAILIVFFIKSANIEIHWRKVLKTVALIVAGVILVMIIFNNVSSIYEMVGRYINKIVAAITSYLGADSSDSGASRAGVWVTVPHEYLFESSLEEFLFGKGVFYQQLDVPYLQAFTDMGFFMGMFYFFLEFILPLKLLVKKHNSEAMLFAQLFIVQVMAYNIYSGVPYGYYKFTPLVLLVHIFDMENRKRDNELVYEMEQDTDLEETELVNIYR